MEVTFTEEAMTSFLYLIDHGCTPVSLGNTNYEIPITLKSLHDVTKIAIYMKMPGSAWLHNYFRDNLLREHVLSLEGIDVPFPYNQSGYNEELKKMWDTKPKDSNFMKVQNGISDIYRNRGEDYDAINDPISEQISNLMYKQYEIMWPHYEQWLSNLIKCYS